MEASMRKEYNMKEHINVIKNSVKEIDRKKSLNHNIEHAKKAVDHAVILHDKAQGIHKTLTPHVVEIKKHALNLHNSARNGQYNKIPVHAEKLIVAVNKAHKELNTNKNLSGGGKKTRTRRSRTRRSRTRRSRTRRSRTRRSKRK